MIKNITIHPYQSVKGNSFDITINLPNECPHCGLKIDPSIIHDMYFFNEDYSKKYIHLHLLCNACLKSFVSEYDCFANDHKAQLIGIYPDTHIPVQHTQNIIELSPEYVEIFNEAHFAEESHLMHICGMGYRKALEFLVKDFAVRRNPDNESEIKNTSLSKCITNYIENDSIKAVALASTWIGNDETHYIRKHEDHDLESLKAFLNATESFINSELEAEKANELINGSR